MCLGSRQVSLRSHSKETRVVTGLKDKVRRGIIWDSGAISQRLRETDITSEFSKQKLLN